MLHAIEKNKSKLYERYWGLQDSSVRGNITAEDEITSTVFGPLEFMAPSEVWCIVRKILGVNILPEKPPTKLEFKLEFWKRLNREGGSDIEPDAELVFYRDDHKPIAILFELKWNASEGHKEGVYQLDEQWKAFDRRHNCDAYDRRHKCEAYHLFIAKEPAVKTVVNALNKGRKNNWGGKLICLSWDDVRGRLEKVVAEDGRAVYRWACLANNFLQLATATRPFGGFGMSTDEVREGYSFPDDFATLTPPLFWDDHWFARLDKLFPSDIPLHQPCIFYGEKP